MGKGCHSKMESRVGMSSNDDCLSKFTVEMFGSKVEDFSSEYARENTASYSVRNIAGECNIFPRYGDFTQACVLRTYGPWWNITSSSPKRCTRPEPDEFLSRDFVDLAYECLIYPDRVNIFETYHPGAVVRILAYVQKKEGDFHDRLNFHWIPLWTGKPELAPQESRVFSPPLIKVYEPAKMIRLEFNSSLCGYYPEIDAVQLIGLKVNDTTKSLMLKSRSNNNEEIDSSLEKTMKKMDLNDDEDEFDEGPFPLLLGEIIEKIFTYLDLRSLCRMAATCRLFKRYAYDSLQYRDVNLQPFWNRVNDDTLMHLQERCQRLKKLNMSWCGNYGLVGTAQFDIFIKACGSQLTSLNLGCCKFVFEPQLAIISKFCPKLEELDLQSCRIVGKYGFVHLSKMDLKRINLYRTTIETGTVISIVKSNPCLEHLNLGSCINVNYDAVAQALSISTPILKSVDFWRAQSLTEVGVNALANSCRELEEIDIGWCSEVRSETRCIQNLVRKCPNLKKLILTANRTICDTDLEMISRCCPQLEQLDILGTGQVSTQAVQLILDNCKRLRLFDVSFCKNISFDTYQSWLKTYPHVDIKKSFVDT